MAKLKPSAAKKACHGRYQAENRWKKNKTKRIRKHCKEQPNDMQSFHAFTAEKYTYTRNSFKGNKKIPERPKLKLRFPTVKFLSIGEQLQLWMT